MKTSRLARALFVTTILSSPAFLAAGPACAGDDEVTAVFVTGSRLDQSKHRVPAPVFQVDAGEIDTRGVTRVEDLLNILPQAFASQTSELSNGATGTSSLNLRGLGPERTLVLIDGKRLPYGSAFFTPVNLDIVPVQLIERIDIVTGGDSAVYGSDAVAGVANFIMRRDFEGVMFDGQVGVNQDGNNGEFANALLDVNGIARPGGKLDGHDALASIIFGANTPDGRGNVTAFFSYQNQNEIRSDARDYSTCTYGPSGPGLTTIGGIACVGSSTFRRFFTPGGDLFLGEDDIFAPFTGAPEQTFNFAPDNFIQRNNERFNITALSRYEITDNVEAYLDLGFTDNTTDAQIVFSGIFFRPFSTNCDNPLIGGAVSTGGTLADALGCDAAAIAAGTDVGLAVGYRNVTGDPRSSFIGLQTFRMVGGFRGDLGDNWSWDAFGQFGRTTERRISTGDLNFASVQDALFVVDDGMGNAVCRSGAANCIPFNLFEFGGVSLEAARSAQSTGFRNGSTEQLVIGGTMQGDLGAYGFQLPWTENSAQGLIGVEWRRDSLENSPRDVSQFLGGFFSPRIVPQPIVGDVRVAEVFMEAQIPVAQGRPFFEELSVNGAYRYSDYSAEGNGVENSFDAHTFAAGVTWGPSPNIRFRGQFQRAVRAPNVIELFTGQNTGLFNATAGANGLFDPCASGPGGVPAPQANAAQCAFTGVSAAQFGTIPDNPAGQLNLVTGGNPLLDPEKSDTYTVGAVITPSFLPGFNLAVDYFDITVNGALDTVPPNTTLNQCLATGNPSFCELINRDAFGSLFLSNVDADGNLTGVFATNANIAQLKTRGLDFNAHYNTDIGGWGSIDFNYVSTVLLELSNNPIPGVEADVECKGLYRGVCGGPNPVYRHRLLTTWQTPWNVDFTATWRYYGGATLDTGQSSGEAFTASGNVLDDFLDSANYLDLAAQYHINENVTLRLGAQNLFGRDPELSTEAGIAPGNGNTFPGVYDSAGRFLFFGVTLTK